MIIYHGGPITPSSVGVQLWKGRHALISFAHPEQVSLVAAVARTFVLDNGAFSFWKLGTPVDWLAYYAWIDEWRRHPAFDWALIPDIIDGSEEENDKLLEAWPFIHVGVPVWHLHESLDRLGRLVMSYPRVALGSSGQWGTPNTGRWWARMDEVMHCCCDEKGRPKAKLHGLRMLHPRILSGLPLSSADSSSVARNIGLDTRWKGTYQPSTKTVRALVLADRIEAITPATFYEPRPETMNATL